MNSAVSEGKVLVISRLIESDEVGFRKNASRLQEISSYSRSGGVTLAIQES